MILKTVSEELARELIDFAPTARDQELGFGESQLWGAVAAHNMIARNGVAYLADEVGMGKTYVALGVLGIMRHLNPALRTMIITPRENIQRKWVKELNNFVRANWRVEDNCVRGLDNRPVHKPIVCATVDDAVAYARITSHGDFIMRATSFSAAVKTKENRDRLRNRLLKKVPWLERRQLNARDPYGFRDQYARAINSALPDFDLLIVDEAHNLRKGFGPKVSTRNRMLGLALGHPDGGDPAFPRYGRRIQYVLLLSATPFTYDYADLYAQLDVVGLGGLRLVGADGEAALPVSRLAQDVSDDEKREIVRRMLIRRVQYLKIGGDEYSKNMYRREWRMGGYSAPDIPMEMEDTKERLVVGLMQKKVAEILGDKRVNNNFQIGMLSSFESFLESLGRITAPVLKGEDDPEDVKPTFEGEQVATTAERKGIDTAALERVVSSYRSEFGTSLPHPKLDATVRAFRDVFDTGNKALLFVRRVATVYELKAKLDTIFDAWIEAKMLAALPDLAPDVKRIFKRYEQEKTEYAATRTSRQIGEALLADDDRADVVGEDEGGSESFFAWFFRGDGPTNLLSGAAFQKNRLSSRASIYSTFFEDDYVSWLLDRPTDALRELGRALERTPGDLKQDLRTRAFRYFRARSKQREGYPRLYVFEAYQFAALCLLAQEGGSLGTRAEIVLQERFPRLPEEDLTVPVRFPGPDDAIGIHSFCTELIKRPDLRDAIWPEDPEGDFRQQFRHREWRRELLSAMGRLGASFIDLYLLAIGQLGSFKLRVEQETERPQRDLAVAFLDLLERQSETDGFHAFFELSQAAKAFHTLISVNFPDIHHQPIHQLAEIFGRVLQRQMPVAGMAGGVNNRLVAQFRMPGFPLILATTDVLQEGEDLHTFCRRVIHYGISWTPSAMEQRTGRVDRIGSLVQRLLDGRERAPDGEELIQVYYPHLQDTVEVLQVRRVLERLNKFLEMMHASVQVPEADESTLDVAREVLRVLKPIPQVTHRLESAYPARGDWLRGELRPSAVRRPDIGALEKRLSDMWQRLVEVIGLDVIETGSSRKMAGVVRIVDGECVRGGDRVVGARLQPFELDLQSQVVGNEVLVRCVSPVGSIPVDDRHFIDGLYHVAWDFAGARICLREVHRQRLWDVTVEEARLFHLGATQYEELEDLVVTVVEAADGIEERLLQVDADPYVWKRGR